MTIKRWLVSLLCCCMTVSSCTALRDVPLPQGASQVSLRGVKPGDTVVVTLRDGSSREVKVVQIDAESLSGTTAGTDVTRYAFADIQTLEARHVSFWKTSGAIGGVLLAIGVVASAVLINTLAHEED